MISFKETLTEQKNTHMTHIEDKVLYGGVEGTRQAINALRSLRDMLKGEQDGNVSVKWDGAPAIFAGTDPSDGVFFVAKKGSSIRTPKFIRPLLMLIMILVATLLLSLSLLYVNCPSLELKALFKETSCLALVM